MFTMSKNASGVRECKLRRRKNAPERRMVIKTSPYAGDEDTILAMDLHVLGLNAKDLGKGFDSCDGSWTRRVIKDVENEIVAVAALVSNRSHHVLATRKE